MMVEMPVQENAVIQRLPEFITALSTGADSEVTLAIV